GRRLAPVTLYAPRAPRVSAIDPLRPTLPSVGGSNEPNGSLLAPGEKSARVTDTSPGVFEMPVADTLTLPTTAPDDGTPADGCTEMVRVVLPEPEAGETVSHGALDVAVHVTLPEPAWVR